MSSKPSDPTMGLRVLTLAGPMADRRMRCLGMTDEERRWRAQFLKDQVLTHEEPREVPEYYKSTTNIFRRLWKTPFRKFQKALEPSFGKDGAYTVRHLVGKTLYVTAATFLVVYYFKYHTNDFSYAHTLEYVTARPTMYPDHPDYPNYPVKKPSDYYDQGFYSSVLCQDVKIEEPPPPPPPPPPPSSSSTTGVVEGEQVPCPALEQKED